MPDRLLQVHIRESDRFAGTPLYEAIVARCREMDIAGATVFRGLEGYGSTADIRRAHGMAHDLPVVITIVDSEEKIGRLVAVLDEMLDKGVMAIEAVHVKRVRKPPVLP